MKSGRRELEKKQARFSSNLGDRGSSGWANHGSERTTQCLEINVPRFNRSSGPHRETCWMPGNFQPSARLTSHSRHPAHSARHFLFHAKPRRVRVTAVPRAVYLPPIRGSTIVAAGKADPARALSHAALRSAFSNGKKAQLPIPDAMRENGVLRLVVSQQHGNGFQQPNKSNAAGGALAAVTREVIQDAESCSRLVKGAQPPVKPASNPAPLVLRTRQQRTDTSNPSANDSGVMLAASPCRNPPNRQTDSFSDDSVLETESRSSEDEGFMPTDGGDALAWLSLDQDGEEEYYTDQRIAEWVSKVNLSLFCTSDDDEPPGSRPVDEQDVSTIKIIYNGD